MRIRLSDVITGALFAAGGVALVAEVRNFQRDARRQELLAESVRGERPHRIVVVGCGFGGLAAINRLGDLVGGDPRFDVLIVDQHNYHLFYPLLYQVATGGVEPGVLAYPARVIAREHHFRFLEAAVQAVDVLARRIVTDAGPVEYDSLILAPGSTVNFFGMRDAEENAMTLKSLADGIDLRNQIVECFEQAARETDPGRRKALLTFTVVGGGATGVELASSISDMIYGTLLKNYPMIDPSEPRLLLIEAQGRLLSGWNPEMSDVAARHLRDDGIELRLNTAVAHVGPDGLSFGSGEAIACATVVWSAGVRAESLVGTVPGETGRDGRVRVKETLDLPDYPGVFVIGDAAAVRLPNETRPLPPTAAIALAEGAQAGENAVRHLLNRPLRPFRYTSKGDLVSLGRGAAAADVFGRVFDGPVGWVLRRAVYLVNLVGFRNRLFVTLDWAFVTFHQRVIASFGAYHKPKILTREFAPQAPSEQEPRKAA